MCLEFSHVKREPLRSIYDFYSFNVIPALGEAVAKDKGSYQYLVAGHYVCPLFGATYALFFVG